MNNGHKDPFFKKWLDALQQESWQLELIISGFALYALFSAFEYVGIETRRVIAEENEILRFVMIFLMVSLFILIMNLTAHVVLRGLWIGAIGLRYVSGDIDYDKLRYTDKFKNFIQRKVGSYDKFIADLEKYCSIIFAITFLIVFYLMAIFTILGSLVLILSMLSEIDNDTLQAVFIIPVVLFYVVGLLFTLVDFVTQGFLKKKKWLARLYYPFYRVFSLLSLSFIYRPIVYNLLDNKFGKRIAMSLIPLYLGIAVLTTLREQKSNYLPSSFEYETEGIDYFENISSPLKYEDELEDDHFVDRASIQSKVITDDYIRLFIPFAQSIEDRIFRHCDSLMPEDDERGLKTSMINFNRDLNKRRENLKGYLACFNGIYSTVIDSTTLHSEFVVTQNSKQQTGFETMLYIKDLKPGRHDLTFQRLWSTRAQDSTKRAILSRIPFWYYPD